MKKSNFIETKNLVHEYSRRDAEGNILEIFQAVDGVDISIKEGEFVAVLGANGSGKSTFAKHLNGLLKATEGTVVVDGLDVSEAENTLKIRQMAGMVFQNPDNQIVAGIVEEDVGFGPENLGIPTKGILHRVTESLKIVNMTKYRKKSPNHLSGGQKQRVAIAGILAMHPKCIILDEATAMLDPEGRKNVMDTILKLNREEHITIVSITHYMDEVINADKIYVLKDGKIALSGTPKEVFSRADLLEKCRIEVPEVTKIITGLRQKGIDVPLDILGEDEFVSWVAKNIS